MTCFFVFYFRCAARLVRMLFAGVVTYVRTSKKRTASAPKFQPWPQTSALIPRPPQLPRRPSLYMYVFRGMFSAAPPPQPPYYICMFLSAQRCFLSVCFFSFVVEFLFNTPSFDFGNLRDLFFVWVLTCPDPCFFCRNVPMTIRFIYAG